MGASSVTGTGPGSAEKSGLKGPSNGRNMFVPQICPHVVMTGEVEVNENNVATVSFPEGPLPLGEENYVVMVTPVCDDLDNDAEVENWYVVKTDVSGQFDHFHIYASIEAEEEEEGELPTAKFAYEVVTVGFGLDIVKDNPITP
jgi:hypothetical protein